MNQRPIVGVCADFKTVDGHPSHWVGNKYVHAVFHAANAVPVILPAIGNGELSPAFLAAVDGLLLTGSYSNVHPRHYGVSEPPKDSLLDSRRDAVTLSLAKFAIEVGVPLLGICRGFQEINVALGGTLHQKVQDVSGYSDHREDSGLALEKQYDPAHIVHIEDGGVLSTLSNKPSQHVNSLHGQGVDKLGDGLRVEARAEDGLIEAFSVSDAKAFAVAVQWHPEWKPQDHPFYAALWQRFGSAYHERKCKRS